MTIEYFVQKKHANASMPDNTVTFYVKTKAGQVQMAISSNIAIKLKDYNSVEFGYDPDIHSVIMRPSKEIWAFNVRFRKAGGTATVSMTRFLKYFNIDPTGKYSCEWDDENKQWKIDLNFNA